MEELVICLATLRNNSDDTPGKELIQEMVLKTFKVSTEIETPPTNGNPKIIEKAAKYIGTYHSLVVADTNDRKDQVNSKKTFSGFPFVFYWCSINLFPITVR